MWEYRATLPPYGLTAGWESVVHDGDTIKTLIDLGFDTRTEKWMRLAGVRAPETTEPGITETRAFVKTWLSARMLTRRWPLRVVTETTRTLEPTEKTSFTRYVGWVYDIQSGECLNEAMNHFLAQHPEWPAGREILPPEPPPAGHR